MAKNIVLTKKEVENLTSLQQEQNDHLFDAGQLEYQLKVIENRKRNLWVALQQIEEKQIKTAQELEEKYGQGTVNLESGEFIKA
jgi:hypothetical protein